MTARNLHAVQEGDPGHQGRRKLAEKLHAPPSLPAEPDWALLFPESAEMDWRLLRDEAAASWERVVPALHRLGLLAGTLDEATLRDYCASTARVVELERRLTIEGPTVVGAQGGLHPHPALSALSSYRTHVRSMTKALGLSPDARAGLKRPEQESARDSPWSS